MIYRCTTDQIVIITCRILLPSGQIALLFNWILLPTGQILQLTGRILLPSGQIVTLNLLSKIQKIMKLLKGIMGWLELNFSFFSENDLYWGPINQTYSVFKQNELWLFGTYFLWRIVNKFNVLHDCNVIWQIFRGWIAIQA